VGRIVEPDIAMARPHQTRIAAAVYTASNSGRDVTQFRIELNREADLLMSVEVDHVRTAQNSNIEREVTRATRVANLALGTLIRGEVIGRFPKGYTASL
jgi:hypothetical protein